MSCTEEPSALRIANGDDVAILDPLLATGSGDLRVMQALHAGLTRFHPATLQPEPGLATSFTSHQGGRRWIFHLRPSLKWSDGTALTSADVLQSWKRLQNPSTGAPFQSWLADAVFTATSPDTLEVSFPFPHPQFAAMCSSPALSVAPVPFTPDAPTSGPYQLESRKIRDSVRVKKNAHYWNALEVQIPRIDFLTVESQFTALNLFLSGEVHYTPNVPALAIPKLLEKFADAFQPSPQFGTYFIRFNTKKSPFHDPLLRQQFSAAIQRNLLAESVGAGRMPAWSFVPPGIPGYPSASLPSPPQKVFDKKIPTHVEYLYNSSELNRDIAEVLQHQWQTNLGVSTRLVNQEWKTFLYAQRQGDYQISRSSWIGDYLDPMTFLEIFQSHHPNNRTGWASAEYDGLIQEARQATQQDRRFQLLHEAETLLLREAPIAPLLFETSQELVSPKLKGFHRNLRGVVDWSRLTLQEEP